MKLVFRTFFSKNEFHLFGKPCNIKVFRFCLFWEKNKKTRNAKVKFLRHVVI